MKKILIKTIVIATFGYCLYRLTHPTPKPESPYKKYANIIPGTYRIGFTNLDQEISLDNVPVIDKIPSWLQGTLLRNGPAKFTCGDSWVADWFDGLAMIHAFSFNNGSVSYRNKYLRSADYEKVQRTGKMSFRGFANDPCRSIFKYMASFFGEKDLFPRNINIAQYTDHFVALSETPLPIEFDPQTLDTLGLMPYDDSLPASSIHDTAHPHYDPVLKEHLGYFTQFGKTSSHNLFRIKDGSIKREIIASVNVDEPSYMHSFAITPHYAVLTALPLVVNPLDLLLKRKAFINNFTWKPELGTKFIVIDRINNKLIGIYKGPAFFAFHTVNAFEQGDSVVVDIITYPDSSTIQGGTFDKLLAPAGPCRMRSHPDSERLFRYTISLKDGTITSKKLSDEHVELPRINYDHYNGKDYVFVYGIGDTGNCESAYVADKLVKINVKTGEVKNWYQKDCYPGEPVFIPVPDAHSEDDGVVVSIVLDSKKEKSFLLVLDAHSFAERARAEVPHHIPFGLHGIYLPDHGTNA